MLTRKRADMRTIKALLTRAEEIAHRLGEQLPGAEHLLLAAIELPDGTARRAFERVGVDPAALEPAIGEAHRAALAAVGIDTAGLDVDPTPVRSSTRLMGFNASGRSAFQAAATRARSRKPARFTGADVVAGVCDQQHGVAARALSVVGADRGALRAAADIEAASAA